MRTLSDLDDTPFSPTRVDYRLVGRILRIGSFVMLAMLTQFIVGAADALMVGSMSDVDRATAGQAALGLGTPLYWMVGGFFSAVGYGTQAITARRYGAHDDEAAGRVLSNSVVVGVLAGIMGGVVAYVTASPLVGFFAESSQAQADLATVYAQIRAFGLGGTVLIFSFKAFFDGLGRTHLHLIASTVMTLFNIALNFPLIYGWEALQIPAMGVEGAAIASAISSWVGLAVMIGASMRREIRTRFRPFGRGHVELDTMGRIVKLMVPSGSASVFFDGRLLALREGGQPPRRAGRGRRQPQRRRHHDLDVHPRHGGAAAHGLRLRHRHRGEPGARGQEPTLAARAGWEAVRAAVLGTIVIAGLCWVFTEQLVYIWNPNNEAVQAALVAPMRLVAVMLPVVAVGLVLSQALYGAGANVYVMVAEGVLHAGVLVPMSWLLGPTLGYGLLGCWAGGGVYVAGLAIAMAARFAGRSWREIEI